MEKQYRRVTDIDEKIKNVSLPYFHWKVLFLVLEETKIEDLVETLSSDENTVIQVLDSLEKNGILELVDTELGSVEKVQDESTEDKQEDLEPEVEEKEEDEIAAEIISESEDELEEIKAAPSEEPVAELVDDPAEEISNESKDDLEAIIEEKIEEESALTEESTEEPAEESIEETIEEEFETEDKQEDDVLKESVSEEFNLDAMEETEEVETKDEEASNDISSLIDEIDDDEASEETNLEAAVEQEPKQEEPVKKEKPKEKSRAGSKTVLVIDDSIVIRKMVEIALEDGDYNIVTSNSGKEGLNLVDDENPDLVIVDMTLPDMNGIDLLKTVKASKGIPVIMLSGKDAPQLVENAKNAGADDFLPKPFRDDDLIEKVKTLLK